MNFLLLGDLVNASITKTDMSKMKVSIRVVGAGFFDPV